MPMPMPIMWPHKNGMIAHYFAIFLTQPSLSPALLRNINPPPSNSRSVFVAIQYWQYLVVNEGQPREPPPGVYLRDIPTVSLYLAISNHVAAAAVLSLTISAGISPAPVCAVISFISNHLAPSPSHHSHRSQTSVTTPPPTLPRVHPSPSPAASSLPWQAAVCASLRFSAWLVREVGRR